MLIRIRVWVYSHFSTSLTITFYTIYCHSLEGDTAAALAKFCTLERIELLTWFTAVCNGYLLKYDFLPLLMPSMQLKLTFQIHYPQFATLSASNVPHCRILSRDKTEWRLISATLCGWGRCFVADQLWLMIRIREEVSPIQFDYLPCVSCKIMSVRKYDNIKIINIHH